jgi:hypothetical protein
MMSQYLTASHHVQKFEQVCASTSIGISQKKKTKKLPAKCDVL